MSTVFSSSLSLTIFRTVDKLQHIRLWPTSLLGMESCANTFLTTLLTCLCFIFIFLSSFYTLQQIRLWPTFQGIGLGGCAGTLLTTLVTFSCFIFIFLSSELFLQVWQLLWHSHFLWDHNTNIFRGHGRTKTKEKIRKLVCFGFNLYKLAKLLVIAFGKYITSRGLRTLRNSPETPTQWKSESISDLPTDWGTGIGST